MSNEFSRASSMSGVRELVGAEILVIDKDETVQKGMTQLLSAASLHVTAVGEPEQAYELLHKKFFSVVVADLDSPHPNAGVETIRRIKELSPTSMVVILTPRKSFDDAVTAVREGAVDIIIKSPESVEYLKDRIMEAAGRSVGKREVNSVLAEVKATQDQFLQLFVDAEKRALDLEDKINGRDPRSALDEAIRVLLVAPDATLFDAAKEAAPAGYEFELTLSGGQGLDRATASRFHIVAVSSDLADLPASMVTRSVKTQSPEVLVLEYSGPGQGGRIDIIDSTKKRVAVDDFRDPKQFIDRLDDLAEAFRSRARDRRYTQAFRERHYDFLRRYVELKIKLDRALGQGEG
ncbi:MAG: response regulator [Deltaproteobacteria bacterium]|nr:response regulator [Deltaproteobacteria bacterium]